MITHLYVIYYVRNILAAPTIYSVVVETVISVGPLTGWAQHREILVYPHPDTTITAYQNLCTP